MAATLVLRRYDPNEGGTIWDNDNPNPRFRVRDADGTPSNWTVNTGTFNWDYQTANISGSTVDITSDALSSAVESVVVIGRVDNSGGGNPEVTVTDGTTTGVVRVANSSSNVDDVYFLASLEVSLASTNSVTVTLGETDGTSNIYGVYFFNEQMTYDNIFDIANSTFVFDASNMNLFKGWSDDSGDTLYDTAANDVGSFDSSYFISWLPTFTGSFDLVRNVDVYLDPASGTTGTAFSDTNDTRLWFYEFNGTNSRNGGDSGILGGYFSGVNPEDLSLDDVDGVGSNTVVYATNDDNTEGNTRLSDNLVVSKLIESTVSGDTTDPINSGNKYRLSHDGDSTGTTSGYIQSTDDVVFPLNSTNAIGMQVLCKTSPSTVDVRMTAHFEWEESG